MAHVLPLQVWQRRVLSNLGVRDAIRVRSSSHTSGTSVIGCDFILRRIDALLRRYELTGLIDVDRHGGTAGAAPLPGGLSRIDYLCRVLYLLERGGRLWAWLGGFLRVAAIYRLTLAMPLVISAEWVQQHWPTRAALHQLPLSLAICKTIGHLLSYEGGSLALTTYEQTNENDAGEDGGPDESGEQEDDLAEPVDNGGAEEDDGQEGPMASDGGQDALIGDGDGEAGGGGQPMEPDDDDHSDESDDHHRIYPHKVGNVRFRILPAYAAPGNQPYDTDDPAIEEDGGRYRYSSFSAFMTDNLMCYWNRHEAAGKRRILTASVPHTDARLGSLMATEAFGDCIVADMHDEYRHAGRTVVLCGHRPNETVAAHLLVWRAHIVWRGHIEIYTTEGRVSGGVSVDECYPVTVRHARGMLRQVRLEREVIDQGRRMDDE
ncbi:unnamed protein product [Vitrella brassicaformis CCMP3155]|uniref:Uncharacterized protein n=1 Tax=Vitrella brassicaformis (strain CCMP3155) TaxID=1169540 RepID=A0A0G4FJH6_VITBC|nr:unnamed protein product [Vitrella brassicaformis CCMP3155]|eukprot:CEM13902.1 unnamed protein product [Vitrella brassicaformis CCMP3155]